MKERVEMYPTMEQVENAGRVHLAKWSRFLPSPGLGAIGTNNFDAVMDRESKIMKRILERFQFLGGWEPWISKNVGWERE